MKDYKSRKFLLVVISVGLLTAGLYFGKIDAGNYVVGLVTLIGLYLGANTVSASLNKNNRR